MYTNRSHRDMLRTWFLTTATTFTLLWTQCSAVTVGPSRIEFSLPRMSRSERCPVVLDHDPPRGQRLFPSTESQALNEVRPGARIVHGDEASLNLVPYLAAVFTLDEERDQWFSKCSGTLVSPRWVISAAFCNVSTADRLLLLGRNTADFDGTHSRLATAADIASVTSHAKYAMTEEGSQYDFAAIELAEDAPEEAKFMKVNVNPALPEPRSFVRVAGFGNTETGLTNPARDRNLLQVDVPTTTYEECSEVYKIVSNVSIDRNAHVCAGYLGKGQCDSCNGDNGGPMIQYNEAGDPVLMGVVSVGAGCALREFPGVYMRTAAFESWMDNEASVDYTKTRAVVSHFNNGISTAAIAGISIAGVILVVLVALIVVISVRKSRLRASYKTKTHSEGPSQTTVPSTLDTGANDWNRTSSIRPKQSRVSPPYATMATASRPGLQVPLQQPPTPPPIQYASVRPVNAFIAQEPLRPGSGYRTGPVTTDYSQAGLQQAQHEYASRGESEEFAPPSSPGNDG